MRHLAIAQPIFEDDNELIDAYDYFYGVIYKLSNSINNKIYIGQTKHLTKKYILRKFKYIDKHSKRPIVRSFIKYGPSKFTCKIIDVATNKKQLDTLERMYIQKYNSQNSKIGYNIANGGEGGIGGPHFKNHTHTEKTKEKMRDFPKTHFATNKGRKFDEVWKKNIGIASSKRFKGIPKTASHKKAISIGHQGISPGNKGKKLVIINNKRKYV